MANITVELNNVQVDLTPEINKILDKNAQNLVDEIKRLSPVNRAVYKNGWTYKKDGDYRVVYNAKEPTLTHLLENGHLARESKKDVKKSKKNKVVRVKAQPHIRPGYEKVIAKYVEDMKKININVKIK